MSYSTNDVISFVQENDVKFIRLSFCDIFGNMKNIAIMPSALKNAIVNGVSIDASAFTGFAYENHSDLLLMPDVSTLTVLPWRPQSGRVMRFFCDIKSPDGNAYGGDVRTALKDTVNRVKKKGYTCEVGTECEFFLFKTDENGDPTKIPNDNASYLDVAPLDKCENVRREICLTLEEMGFSPESSRHEYGFGQNEIDFRHDNMLTAADNLAHFKSIVKTIAAKNGLYASFMPKPLKRQHGNSLHINISVRKNGKNIFSSSEKNQSADAEHFIAGILNRIREITAFLNPTTNSYRRFGECLAPKYIDWSYQARSQLIRIPNATPENARIELRSADPACNPHIAFNLILRAGIEGIENKTELMPQKSDISDVSGLEMLPDSLHEAFELALSSEFIRNSLSDEILNPLYSAWRNTLRLYDDAEDKELFEDNFYFNSTYFNSI